MRTAILIGAACLGLSGCAHGGLEPPTARSTNTPHLRHSSDPETGATQLVLPPVAVDRVRRRGSTSRGQAAVGALLVTRVEGSKRVGGLALVIQTRCAESIPVMTRNRQVALEVDGVRVEAEFTRDPRFYRAQYGPDGVVETMIIPMGIEFLQRLVTASSARAELAGSMTFDFGHRSRAALAAFLLELMKQPSRPVAMPDRVASIAQP